jgi:hypothetical protein
MLKFQPKDDSAPKFKLLMPMDEVRGAFDQLTSPVATPYNSAFPVPVSSHVASLPSAWRILTKHLNFVYPLPNHRSILTYINNNNPLECVTSPSAS